MNAWQYSSIESRRDTKENYFSQLVQKGDTEQYIAPPPKRTFLKRGLIIASYIIFPPVILWENFRYLTNAIFGKMLGRMILRAQIFEISDKIKNDQEFNLKNVIVKTHDSAVLDTLEISRLDSNQEKTSPNTQKYIIHFLGNNRRYRERLESMKTEAKDLGATVIGFDYRGVNCSLSHARSSRDLVVDGIAQVQRLIDKGINPQNIILKGHSLGGGIATLVAHHFHQFDKPIKLFNDRSFSSATNARVGLFLKNYSKSHLSLRILMNVFAIIILKPLIKLCLLLTNWDMNISGAFKAIPEADREYTVVRYKDDYNHVVDDENMTYYGSLHRALLQERRQHKKLIQCAKNGTDNKEKIESLDNLKKQLKFKKMKGDHDDRIDEIKNRDNKSGQEFFKNYVTEGKHSIAYEIQRICSPC